MPTVTFVLGLCGSGKSWLVDQIRADIKFHDGFWLPERRFANLAAVVGTLRGGGHVAIAEIAFCQDSQRQQILQMLSVVPALDVRWICIENDPSKANANCRRRQNHGNADEQVKLNERLTRSYTYPDGAEIRPMWPPAEEVCLP